MDEEGADMKLRECVRVRVRAFHLFNFHQTAITSRFLL